MTDKQLKKLSKEAHSAMDDIESGLKEAKKLGVKKLPKSILNQLNKVDKQFKDFEKMIRKNKK